MAYSEERIVEPHTTVIERRGGGGTAAIAAILVILAAVAAYFFLVNDNRKTDAVTGAAQAIEKTADKAGDKLDGQ